MQLKAMNKTEKKILKQNQEYILHPVSWGTERKKRKIENLRRQAPKKRHGGIARREKSTVQVEAAKLGIHSWGLFDGIQVSSSDLKSLWKHVRERERERGQLVLVGELYFWDWKTRVEDDKKMTILFLFLN